MFALFPKFGARTRTHDLWPFLISKTGLKFLIWTQDEIHPGNRASPVNWVHMKRPLKDNICSDCYVDHLTIALPPFQVSLSWFYCHVQWWRLAKKAFLLRQPSRCRLAFSGTGRLRLGCSRWPLFYFPVFQDRSFTLTKNKQQDNYTHVLFFQFLDFSWTRTSRVYNTKCSNTVPLTKVSILYK